MLRLAYFGREPLENRLGRVTHEVEHGWQVVGVARKRPRPPALFEFSTADVTQLRLVYLVCDRVTTVSLEQPIACVAHGAATLYPGKHVVHEVAVRMPPERLLPNLQK